MLLNGRFSGHEQYLNQTKHLIRKMLNLKSLGLHEISEQLLKSGIPKKGEGYTDGIESAILVRIDERITGGFPVADLAFKFSDRKDLVIIYDVPNLSPAELKKEQDLIQECRDAKNASRYISFQRISRLVKEYTGKDLSEEEVNKLNRLDVVFHREITNRESKRGQIYRSPLGMG